MVIVRIGIKDSNSKTTIT